MSPQGTRRPILMIVHAYYEEDPRVRREAESLVAAGWAVDVIGLRHPGEPKTAVIDGVNLRRLPVRRHQGAGLPVYLWEYGTFLARSMFAAVRAHRRRHYGLVQVHTLPDYLVFAALPLKLAGVPVLLDLHEAMPEFFKGRFPRAANPISYRLLLLQERLSIALADELLTVNEPLAERLRRRGADPTRLTVVMNSPDLRLFSPAAHPRRKFMADGVLRLVYAGAITPTYELDVVLRAMALVRRERPSLEVAATLYGRGDAEESLMALARELGLAGYVEMPGRIPIRAVAGAVAAADVGIAATRLDSYSEVSLSTKILEYGALEKPVVATRLPTIELYFGQDTLSLYGPGDPASLAQAILHLVDDPSDREARVKRTALRVAELGWAQQAEAYHAVVNRLAARPRGRRKRPAAAG
ncbi:MAG: glycosyltransferase [Candidatus Limnocylindrales bacterium]|jgi:glycosyltransferase involved in cell wall biosynthesis